MVDVADPEWQSMILFGLYTGQRLGDVARLTWVSPLGWEHVNLSGDYATPTPAHVLTMWPLPSTV